MSLQGDPKTAIGLVSAIGPIDRFRSPKKLVSYFGLNPRVTQSGNSLAYTGRISKRGRSQVLPVSAPVQGRLPG